MVESEEGLVVEFVEELAISVQHFQTAATSIQQIQPEKNSQPSNVKKLSLTRPDSDSEEAIAGGQRKMPQTDLTATGSEADAAVGTLR